jgi:hypothetical protein
VIDLAKYQKVKPKCLLAARRRAGVAKTDQMIEVLRTTKEVTTR